MIRIFALFGIGAVMAWVGVAEILASNFFLGLNTLAIVVICLLVATDNLPPKAQADAPSADLPPTAASGSAAVATDRAA